MIRTSYYIFFKIVALLVMLVAQPGSVVVLVYQSDFLVVFVGLPGFVVVCVLVF